MKSIYNLLIFGIIIIGVSTDYLAGHNGRPKCGTEEEIKKFYWRNNNDPTVYWACNDYNVPAEQLACPAGSAFSTHRRQCIGWDQWEWEEPQNPPTMAFL